MPPLLVSLRPSPFPCLSLRRLLLFRCSASSAATPSSSLAPYHASFARRMALAGIHPHYRIAVGVSGGPDSMALCVLAAAWKKEAGRKAGYEEGPVASAFVDGLLGVVVDHGLRPESADEARIVRGRVRGMGVECDIARCEWPDGCPRQGQVQEAAREVRYQKLLDICIKQQIGILLIAHHSDDQAELFVLRLSRNSGVLGLAGTAFVSQLFASNVKYDGEKFRQYGILLVRPMLDFSKNDMYKICQGSNQSWVEDPTNTNMMYARNRIRASLRDLSTEGTTFLSEIHKLISACRLTRACVDGAFSMIAKQSVSILEYGYAVIDLENLDPLNVDDLILSQYLAYTLQFVSQRQRPLRGRSVRLLLDYIRTIPCKAALTVAGCYLCAVPRSKGAKVLVCCSVDWMESSSSENSYKCSYEEQAPPAPEIDQIILEGRLQSNKSMQNCSNMHFLCSKSSMDVLNKANDLNIVDDFTLEKLCYLQTDEHNKFIAKEHKHEEQDLEETNIPDCNVLSLCPGETCHFMSRFLITWKAAEYVNEICLHGKKESVSKFCAVNLDGGLEVRHMVDTDWLFLVEVCNIRPVEENLGDPKASCSKMEMDNAPQHSRYLQRSAQKALQVLRSIPAAARRTLPVLTNAQGDIMCIPSVGFRCCPSLLIEAIFFPRVPLGGGYSSYF
ncbi:hypothetical protein BS78_04G114700 [Paspalum vaginatum]|nr:hypothetical protein BS78_04G114700 [Paspalum vaginatum]KAJ1278904.1 hypothetical protein BS78_04G114700 [Paspalum vaginatum]